MPDRYKKDLYILALIALRTNLHNKQVALIASIGSWLIASIGSRPIADYFCGISCRRSHFWQMSILAVYDCNPPHKPMKLPIWSSACRSNFPHHNLE